MRQRRIIANVALLLLILLATAACGGEAAPSAPAPAAPVAVTGAPAAAPGGANAPAPGAPKAPTWDRKVIRNANLTLIVVSVEDSLAAVRDIATEAGGIVFSSDSHYQGDALTAAVTIQVPADAFDSVMTRLRKVGSKVSSETSSSQDVTEEYVDLTSQVKNLQAQEEQLRALMSRAGTVEETLTVERELGQVQGQIEQGQGRLNYLSRRSDFSSIVVNLQPQPKETSPSAPLAGWQPGVTAARAWAASLQVLSGIGDALISTLVFFWWCFPILLLCVVLAGRIRRRGRRAAGPSVL